MQITARLEGEEGLKYEIPQDATGLEQTQAFKYLGSVLDESSADVTEWRRKVALLVPVLLYGSETTIWRQKVVQLDSLRNLLDRMDRVPTGKVRELCGVEKRVDERNDESVLR